MNFTLHRRDPRISESFSARLLSGRKLPINTKPIGESDSATPTTKFTSRESPLSRGSHLESIPTSPERLIGTTSENHTADSAWAHVDGYDKSEKGRRILGHDKPERKTRSSFNPFRHGPHIPEGPPSSPAPNQHPKARTGPETRISTNPFRAMLSAPPAVDVGYGQGRETQGQSMGLRLKLDNLSVLPNDHSPEDGEETLINPFRNLTPAIGKPNVQVNPITSASAKYDHLCTVTGTLPSSPNETDVRRSGHLTTQRPLPNKLPDIAKEYSQGNPAEGGNRDTLLKDGPYAGNSPPRTPIVSWGSSDDIPEIIALDADDSNDSSLLRSNCNKPQVLRKRESRLSPLLARNRLAVIVATEEDPQSFVLMAPPSGAQESQGDHSPDLPLHTDSFLTSLPSGEQGDVQASHLAFTPAETSSLSSPLISAPAISTTSQSLLPAALDRPSSPQPDMIPEESNSRLKAVPVLQSISSKPTTSRSRSSYLPSFAINASTARNIVELAKSRRNRTDTSPSPAFRSTPAENAPQRRLGHFRSQSEQVNVQSIPSSRNFLKPLPPIKDNDLSAIVIESQTLKDSLDRALRELQQARQEIAQSNLQNANLLDQLDNIRKPNHETHAQQLHVINSELDKAETATLSPNLEQQDWKRRYDEAGEATKKIIAELESAHKQVWSLTTERDQRLEERILKLQSTQSSLQQSKVLIASLTKDKQDLEERLEQMREKEQTKNTDTELQQASARVFSLTKDKEALLRELNVKGDKERLAYQRLDAVEQQVQILNKEKKELQDRLDKSQQEQQATRSKLAESQTQLQLYYDEKQWLQAERKELRDRFGDLQQKQLTMRSELRETQAKVQTSQGLQEQLEELQGRFEKLRQKQNATRSELQETQTELRETQTQLQSSQGLQEQLEELQDCFEKLRQKQKDTRSELQDAQRQLQSSYKEKQRWQEQLEVVQLQLNRSQRQIRSLDHLTRFQLEIRQEWLYGSIKRGKFTTSSTPSPEFIDALLSLNESIFRNTRQFVPKLERVKAHGNKSKRAKTMLGEWIVSMMEEQATKDGELPRFLMGVILEIFMVTWCSAIIEAWYPKRQTFADLLIELSSQTRQGNQNVVCGKRIRVIPGAAPINFHKWVEDIMDDLSQILRVAGVAIRSQGLDLFLEKFYILVKDAYKLRTALAEKDVCGGLELVVVTPGTFFQPKLMDEAHLSDGERDSDSWLIGKEQVAGTVAMGLQLVERFRDGVPTKKPRIILQPKVILDSALRTSIN